MVTNNLIYETLLGLRNDIDSLRRDMNELKLQVDALEIVVTDMMNELTHKRTS